MSTDYSVACDTCKMYRHLGQRFASMHYAFGYGKNDDETRNKILEWISEHVEDRHKVSIYVSQFEPAKYTWLEDEEESE